MAIGIENWNRTMLMDLAVVISFGIDFLAAYIEMVRTGEPNGISIGYFELLLPNWYAYDDFVFARWMCHHHVMSFLSNGRFLVFHLGAVIVMMNTWNGLKANWASLYASCM